MGDLRDQVVERVLSRAEKRYEDPRQAGFLSDQPVRGYVPSGSASLDYMLGRPGFPLGRVVSIKGWSGSGKSMLCCHVMAKAQEQGGLAVLIDSEAAYDSEWATSMGVDTDNLICVMPETVEDAVSFIERDILDEVTGEEEFPIVVVIDSLSAMPTDSEKDDDYDSKQPGVHAKLVSKAMRKLTPKAAKKNVMMIFVSQLREALMQFGSSTSTIGGHAIPFHAALVMEIEREETLFNDNKEEVGFLSKVKAHKNKIGGKPLAECKIPFYYSYGIDKKESYLYLALDIGYVSYNRGWYSIEDRDKQFRRSDWEEIIEERPGILEEILNQAGLSYDS